MAECTALSRASLASPLIQIECAGRVFMLACAWVLRDLNVSAARPRAIFSIATRSRIALAIAQPELLILRARIPFVLSTH